MNRGASICGARHIYTRSAVHIYTKQYTEAEVNDYFDNYFDFKYSLEDLLGREVDLLEEQTIKNPYLKKNVDTNKALIYG